MGQHDNGDGTVNFSSFLDDRVDADIVLTQDTGYLGEDPGLINGGKTEIVRGRQLFYRPYGDICVQGVNMGKRRHEPVDPLPELPCQVYEV